MLQIVGVFKYVSYITGVSINKLTNYKVGAFLYVEVESAFQNIERCVYCRVTAVVARMLPLNRKVILAIHKLHRVEYFN